MWTNEKIGSYIKMYVGPMYQGMLTNIGWYVKTQVSSLMPPKNDILGDILGAI